MKRILYTCITIVLLSISVPTSTDTSASSSVALYYYRFLESKQSEIDLLSRLINSESGTETFHDKLMVGSVVLNRMRKRSIDMQSVIFEPNQFSGVHDDGFTRTAESDRAAMMLIISGPIDTSAIYFLNPDVSTNRSWVRKVMRRELVVENKNHFFYK
jgi:spore germination cell wall hydrolase CwlJ-like protein